MFLQNINVIASLHGNILGGEVQSCSALPITKSTPHHYTVRMFYRLHCVPGIEPLGRRTVLDSPLTSMNVLLSLNITFFQSSEVQSLHLLQNSSRLFFIALVRRGFLAARRAGNPRSFCRRCRIVLIATFWRVSGCFILSDAAEIEGFNITSRFNSLSDLSDVFLGAPEPGSLGGVVPGGTVAAASRTR